MIKLKHIIDWPCLSERQLQLAVLCTCSPQHTQHLSPPCWHVARGTGAAMWDHCPDHREQRPGDVRRVEAWSAAAAAAAGPRLVIVTLLQPRPRPRWAEQRQQRPRRISTLPSCLRGFCGPDMAQSRGRQPRMRLCIMLCLNSVYCSLSHIPVMAWHYLLMEIFI